MLFYTPTHGHTDRCENITSLAEVIIFEQRRKVPTQPLILLKLGACKFLALHYYYYIRRIGGRPTAFRCQSVSLSVGVYQSCCHSLTIVTHYWPCTNGKTTLPAPTMYDDLVTFKVRYQGQGQWRMSMLLLAVTTDKLICADTIKYAVANPVASLWSLRHIQGGPNENTPAVNLRYLGYGIKFYEQFCNINFQLIIE